MGDQIKRIKINPRRAMSCFDDESLLGHIKKIGVMCHRGAVCERMLLRYHLFLELRWQDAKRSG